MKMLTLAGMGGGEASGDEVRAIGSVANRTVAGALACLILVALLGGWFWMRRDADLPVLGPRESELARAPTGGDSDGSSLRLADGWSTHGDTSRAVLEAMEMMLTNISSPKFVVVFFTSPHSPQLIREGIRQAAPDARVLGMESANAVFTSAGLHQSSQGALAVLGFSSPALEVGIAGESVSSASMHRDIARRVLSTAASDAGRTQEEPPTAVITGQVIGHSEDYCSVLNDVLTTETPVIGGNSITSRIEPGAIIANDRVFTRGFVAALLYTETRIGNYFHGGFSGRMKQGVVTGVDAHDSTVVARLDHRPALEVYNEWTGGEYRDVLNPSRPTIVNSTVLKPLAKALTTANGEAHYVALHPWRFNPGGSMNVGVQVKRGDRLHYVEGSQESLVNRSGVVARRALAQAHIPLKQLAGGIHIYCVGAGMNLGFGSEGLVSDMVNQIKEKASAAPFIGGFFGGEQGSIPEHGVVAGNLMSSMMVFSR